MAARLLLQGSNWRSNSVTCPLLQQAGETEAGKKNSVLAGADVLQWFDARDLDRLLVATEGFFYADFNFSPGIWVAVVIWRFWCREIGRGP